MARLFGIRTDVCVSTQIPIRMTNKSLAAPPQPPKQFTDEELKQQYGIHLATRLQTDESGNQKSKWADMEDEEDDWAPETLEWMDGTKSSIVAAEQAAPVEQTVVVLKKEEQQTPQSKPTFIALKKTVGAGPPKTILRPGAAQLAKQDGSSGQGTSDQKPSLVAKANVPPPTKSPWAPLPPVERASPVFVAPAPAQNPAKFQQQDRHAFDTMQPSSAAREIETDTFDRSWRDGDRGSRELFNSQSGRYEPAPERRRGSFRQEHGYNRQPALLQRQSQQDIGSPAGPSSAFQTRSSGQLDGSPFSRRRGSSVSGTSSSLAERRMSIAKGPESSSPQAEPRGIVVGHDMAPPATKPEQAPVAPAQPQPEQPVFSVEEELARQKKLMLEKRELAIRRRKEEEEREEAARRERIRIKMESLGMMDAKSTVTDSTLPNPAVSEAQTGNAPPTEPAQSAITTKQAPLPQAKIEAQIPSQSPAAGNPNPTSDIRPDFGSRPSAQSQPDLSPLPSKVDPAPLPTSQHQSPNTRNSYQAGHGVAPSSYSSPGEQKAQPSSWKSPALDPDSFATWGNSNSNSMTSHTSQGNNVWGPPRPSRLLGNGTFGDPRLHHQPNGIAQSAAFGRQRMARVSPQTFGLQESSLLPQQLTSDHQLPSPDLLESRENDLLVPSQSSAISPVTNQARPYQPAPIGPPPRNVSHGQQQQPAPHRGAAAWGQFAAQAELDTAARKVNVSDQPTRNSRPTEQRWKETFKQTRIQDEWHGGPREIIATEKVVHGGNAPATLPSVISPAPPIAQTQMPNMQHTIGEPWQQTGRENAVRLPTGPTSVVKPATMMSAQDQQRPVEPPQHLAGGQQSRFFPSTLYGGSPPPEEEDHPVNYGDIGHPLVNLPAPKPQVRLPPSSTPASADMNSAIMPPRMASQRIGAQPLVNSSDWQARFNGLFGRVQTMTATPPSPPKTPPKMQAPSPAVMTFSKAGLDLDSERHVAHVSLPPSPVPAVSHGTVEEMATRHAPDDIFNVELSFGSIPKVTIPRGAVYPERYNGKSLLKMPTNSKFEKPVEAQSKHLLPALIEDGKRPGTITIYIAQSGRAAKDLLMPQNKSGPHSRKAFAKSTKNKSNFGAKEFPASPSGLPDSLQMPKRGSRQASFQKPQPPASTPPKGPAVENTAGSTSTGPAAGKKSKWAKPPKGRTPAVTANV